jgi:hypothetical protein
MFLAIVIVDFYSGLKLIILDLLRSNAQYERGGR